MKYILLILFIYLFVLFLLGREKIFLKIKVNKKKIYIFCIGISVSILIGGIFFIFDYYRTLSLCNDKCSFTKDGWKFSDPSIPLIEMNFSSKKECLDFCKNFLKDVKKWKSVDLKSLY